MLETGKLKIKTEIILILTLGVFCIAGVCPARQSPEKILAAAVGENDSVLVKDVQRGIFLFAQNIEKPLIPASTIKVVTSLAAIHYLGERYCFFTDCYQRDDGALILKGYGDPAFVSEEIDGMALTVSRLVSDVSRLVVDYSYFDVPPALPGRTQGSLEPYDAPSGALCANFNTVAFTRKKGIYVTTELQTPLLPFAVDRIKETGRTCGRLMIIQDQRDAALYAGELFAYFLARHGCPVSGAVVTGRVNPETDRMVHRYYSQKSVREIVSQLLLFSSNFTANQLMLACGAVKYGPPGTHSKGLQAIQEYLRQELGTQCVKLAEGAGLSRDTRVSAETMCRVLDAFAPYHELMRRHKNEYYKTGTLTGVSTRAGYIFTRDGRRFQYVVMCNTPGKEAERLMPEVKRLVRQADN